MTIVCLSNNKETSIKIVKELNKIGIEEENETTIALVKALEENLVLQETDMTIFYRNLANVLKTDTSEEALAKIILAFYQPDKIVTTLKTSWLNWMELYLQLQISLPIWMLHLKGDFYSK